jgi:hypothetical protein
VDFEKPCSISTTALNAAVTTQAFQHNVMTIGQISYKQKTYPRWNRKNSQYMGKYCLYHPE